MKGLLMLLSGLLALVIVVAGAYLLYDKLAVEYKPSALETFAIPSVTTIKPENTTARPSDTTAKPSDTTAKPSDTTAKPSDTTAKPADTTAKPADTTAKPSDTTAKPSDTTAKPADTTAKPSDTTARPADTTAKPADTTAKPADTTAKPVAPPAPPTQKWGNAPDFTVLDKNGNKVKLSDMQGKPIVINFWATWCGYCKMEMPTFEKVYKEYGDDVVFMMVNITDGKNETVAGVKKYVSSNGYTFPVYFDTELSAAIAYNASGLPVTYFIDKNGNLAARRLGALTEENLLQGISLINK